MRIGGGIEKPYTNPDEWIALVKDLNYSAVLMPVKYDATKEEKKDYLDYINKYNLVIGEAGVWRNPISIDETERKIALDYCKKQLTLADELGANCCVNIAGARGEKWAGFYKENYWPETYALIVDTVRDIIDSVNPKNTFYTIEPMPWMTPDTPDAYLKLLKAVDRKAFAVHLDFTNMINTPYKYVYRTEFISECFEKLGPYIKSIHIKDVTMREVYPCSIEECMPGQGTVDYVKVLRLTEGLGKETTAFVEHLDTYEEYKVAVRYVRGIADTAGVTII
ncbi:sugar phosphate isomerase/epimerase family protein [Anaerocolumna sp. MB42-C2]|uniref:sugar phosphate isomerase/epimerase family protein n=1 Tax=Anaerocolumna sp. MB42-C2 TaxID=3070997 RepID=UPI0027E16642|nr:TIM barrel protein [Anaerocolumna sp. MB42-C2]WMJ87258.1 TIM barrel protein [Anaerocolumna sp. MB42-C2]